MVKLDIAIETGLKKLGSSGTFWCREYNSLIEETFRKYPRGYKAKDNDKWCAIFISDIMMLSGMKNFPIEVSAEKMFQKFDDVYIKNLADEPIRKYDLIFYDWNKDKWKDHLGIVIQRDAKYLQVLEGNYNGHVGVRKILSTSTSIFAAVDLEKWCTYNEAE